MNKSFFKYVISAILMFFCLSVSAQQQRGGFDPKKFEADLEQFITAQAGFTPYEASRFFPLYREMQEKKRALFIQKRRYRHVDPSDEKESRQAIQKLDALDQEMFRIQAQYHTKFVKIVPAGKVLKAIRAEDRFHRQAFRRAAKR